VIVLLAGSAAAFAVTEHLKLQPSPLSVSGFTHVFSPICDCPTAKAQLALRVRKPDRLTVEVVNDDGDTVRTLVRDEHVPAGRLVLEWDGRDDSGRIAPEAVYRPRVHLAEANRTFRLLNPMRVDVTAPRLRLLSAKPTVLARRGDYRKRRLVVSYRLGEAARPFLFVNGIQRLRGKVRRGRGHVDWWGKVDGRHVPAGRYRVKLFAVDPAGNRSAQYTFSVRVR
jgi:hypothetical protein